MSDQGVGVDDVGPLAEIDLGGFAGVELEHGGRAGGRFPRSIGHRPFPLNECAGEDTGCERKSETSAGQRRGGSIAVNMAWPHYAEYGVAPLG